MIGAAYTHSMQLGNFLAMFFIHRYNMKKYYFLKYQREQELLRETIFQSLLVIWFTGRRNCCRNMTVAVAAAAVVVTKL